MTIKRVSAAAMLALILLTDMAFSPSTAYAGDCYAIGQQMAADQGGQLARATPAVQDGQPICKIVIIVPGRDGSRPRRAEFVVPND